MLNNFSPHIKDDFPPENENGNIEYKLKILCKNNDMRKSELTNQMKFRVYQGLEENNIGEALYRIGIADNGFKIGVSKKNLDISVSVLQEICSKLNYSLKIIEEIELEKDRYIADILVRDEINTDNQVDIGIATAGNVDSGKSTLLGVLTSHELDDGRGRARIGVMGHKHEIESGRTSAINQQLMGFDIKGNTVKVSKDEGWDIIVKKSKKLITFSDLAGHKKYLKTTIRGVAGGNIQYIMMTLGANSKKIKPMTREHIYLSLVWNIPLFIVITKKDLAPNIVLKTTIQNIKKILRKIRKIPYMIDSSKDIMNACLNIKSNSIVPIFQISNVTGEGLDNLKKFLNYLPSRLVKNNKETLFQIQETYRAEGFPTILSGYLESGSLKVGDNVFLGPTKKEKFIPTSIKTMEYKTVRINEAIQGKSYTIAIRNVDRKSIEKGMILTKKIPNVYWGIKAKIKVVKGSHTSMRKGYEPTVHIKNIRQVCKIINIVKISETKRNVIGPGDEAIVIFKFMIKPINIERGEIFVFREGRTRGQGTVLEIYKEIDEHNPGI